MDKEKTLAQIELLREEFPGYGSNFDRALTYLSEQYDITPIELAEKDEKFFYQKYPSLYEDVPVVDEESQELFESSLDEYYEKLKEETAVYVNPITSFFFHNPNNNNPNMPNSIVARALSSYGDDGGGGLIIKSFIRNGRLFISYDDEKLQFIEESTLDSDGNLLLVVDDEQINPATVHIANKELELEYIGGEE
jgi:hypothetical protein